jgi:hypothetical protein
MSQEEKKIERVLERIAESLGGIDYSLQVIAQELQSQIPPKAQSLVATVKP